MTDKLLTLLLLAPALAMAHMNRCPTTEESDAFERTPSDSPIFAGRIFASTAIESTYLYQTQHFVIAYQKAGVHSVAGATTDSDKDGVPDNIEEIGKIAERVWRLGVDTLKYKAPPGRDSITGYKVRTKTGKFPIVIGDLATFSTSWAGKQFMGYALRPLVDPDSLGGGQLAIENDFLDGGVPIRVKVGPENSANGVDSILYDYSKDPVKGWSTTIAHEFYHSLQYHYDQYYRYAWHEMTATWFAKRAYPDVKHHWQYLGAFIKNNYNGPFGTWDAMAPYYNYAFVEIAAKEFGDNFLLEIWPSHRDSFEIEEDHWFGKAIARHGFVESPMLRGYAREYLRLIDDLPGLFNDNGAWRNSSSNKIGTGFVSAGLVSPPGLIEFSAQTYGNMYCRLDSRQFEVGNLIAYARADISSAAVGILRYPSKAIEAFTVSRDSIVIGKNATDTAWRLALISGFIGLGDATASVSATTKSALKIERRHNMPGRPAQIYTIDLRGRPVTSATRGVIIEGSPETGWKRRVEFKEFTK